MKTIISGLILFLLCTTVFTQNNIDVNDMDIYINNNGTLSFENFDTPHFIVPKDLGVSSILAGQIWLGGLDDGGQLHLAAQTYRQSGDDFWPGPVADDYSAIAYTEKYDRVWVEDKESIEFHKLHWADGGYIVPAAIADWPGNGNVANGEAVQLAPYYDYNVNDIYDPENGDYPIIRGDEALFFMMNDAASEHTESGGEKLGLEIHGMAYAFAGTATDTAMNQTVFMHYEIINRSSTSYHDFYTGAWLDIDVGCYVDDWIGCDTSMNLFYGFNGDNFDGCEPGYGYYVPAQGLVWLNSVMSSGMYFNNDYSVIGNPEEPMDYYNYLHGIWKDDQHLTYGGNGYGGTQPADFVYSSDPLDPDGWSEMTESNPAAERRGICATGPFTLDTTQSICLDIALPFAIRAGTDHNAMVAVLRERTQEIIDFYDVNFSDCAITGEKNADYVPDGVEQLVITGVSFYPNPVENYMVIEPGHDMKNGRLQILNAAGELMAVLNNINGRTIRLDNPGLAPGIYLFRLSDESISGTGKFTVE